MWIVNNALFVALFTMGVLYVSYKVYGTFLARHVFGFDASRRAPSEELKDGVDYVPTRKSVLFGHHFASIAGLGPIIGPAIAVYWGWVPALAWVLVGCVLIGGVHDLAALFASLRHKARGIGDLTYDILGARARLLFLLIIFFLLALAMGVFALFMTKLFLDLSPQAVMPTFMLIAIAMLIGLLTYKLNWSLGKVTVVGVALMLLGTYLGMSYPVPLYQAFLDDPRTSEQIATSPDQDFPEVQGIRGTRATALATYFEKKAEDQPEVYGPLADDVKQARGRAFSTWVIILLAYAGIASILPVWLLLQPRDYINCFQLYIGLGLLLLGFIVWHPAIEAPPFGDRAIMQADQAPSAWPLLFITIACGAVSGFHNLVSSGTTARQIRSEGDAQFIGYGAMLTEGFLAVLVILACVAGLSKAEFGEQYGHWAGLDKRALGAFLIGAGHVVAQPFMMFVQAESHAALTVYCSNFVAVVVVSFAMTTLDSATRLLRFNVEEIGKAFHLKPLRNRYLASIIAVVAIGYFALMKINGQPAGLVLWQLFGTTNQMLAMLGLLVASVLLYQMGKPMWYTLLPMFAMAISVTWAISLSLMKFYTDVRSAEPGQVLGPLSLLIVGSVLAVMAALMVIEAVIVFLSPRGGASRTVTQVAD